MEPRVLKGRLIDQMGGCALVRAATAFAAVLVAGVLACIAVAGTTPAQAWAAEGMAAWGAQTLFSEADLAQDPVEVNAVNMSGEEGATVYLTVTDDAATLAKYLPHVLGEGAQDGANAADTFALEAPAATLEDKLAKGSYHVVVYADRTGKTVLFDGTLWGVWARVPAEEAGDEGADEGEGADGGEGAGTGESADPDPAAATTTILIGAVAQPTGGSLLFAPPASIYRNGQAYELASSTPVQEGKLLYYDYTPYDPADTQDATVSYVDEDGALLSTATIPGVPQDGSKSFDVPELLQVNGTVYRTLWYTGQIEAKNPGQMAFTVPCAAMSDADKLAAGHYLATFRMVDQDGALIATDSVLVEGAFQYTAPTSIYKYKSVNGEQRAMAYSIAGNSVYRLDAAQDAGYVVNGARTITVPYQAADLDAASVEVTFNLVDSQEDASLSGRLLGTKTATVDAQNPTAEPDAVLEFGGVAYHVAGQVQDYAYTYGSGELPVVDVYYTPDDNGAPGFYTVAVNYVDIRTGNVLDTATYDSRATQANQEFAFPASFGQGGNTYVLLDGQGSAIRHNHYSNTRTYAVYYRNSNDDLSAGTTVARTRVVYVGGAGTDNTATGAGAAAGTVYTAGLYQQGTYTATDGNGNGTLRNEAGTDSTTERIEDTANPLASGTDATGAGTGENGEGESGQQEGNGLGQPIAATVVIAIVAVLLGWLLAARRRKNQEEKSGNYAAHGRK